MSKSILSDDQAVVAEFPIAAPATYNVQPCRGDPVFGLLKDRWRLSPFAVTALFLGMYLGGGFLCCWISGTAFPHPGLVTCYTQDWARLAFSAFLIPVGAGLAMRFYGQTEITFERLHKDQVVRAGDEEYNSFLRALDHRYNSVALHLATFGLAVFFRFRDTYYINRDGIDQWLDLTHGVGAYYHLTIILLSWYVGLLLVSKAVITATAMRRVFTWPVNVQPFHPDGCGGLRLLTDISITIALCVGLASLGVVIFLWFGEVTPFSLPVIVALALILLTPVVFISCIYGAHKAMLDVKQDLLRQINGQVQPSYQALCSRLAGGEIMNEAAESILRLEALHALVRRLPVWPVNTQVLAQVSLSVAVPFVVLMLQLIIEHSLGGKH